jgi:uncharacterized protein YdaU (DUF1376 family)
MKYYQHHIGDFDKATRHLTRLERSVYRDLIELYYDTEQPLTLDRAALCRKIIARSNEESTAVEQVLNEFFTETPTGWYHERCESEIEKYRVNKAAHWTRLLRPEQKAALNAERRAKKLQATPPWLTDEHRTLIYGFHRESLVLSITTGTPHEVDHIIPLQSKHVCGLHVPWNLQILTATENRQKSNFFEVAS